MLRPVANPLGSGAAAVGSAWLVKTGLDFEATCPFAEALTAPCKTGTGAAFKEAFGFGFGTTGRTEFWTALGMAPGTDFVAVSGSALVRVKGAKLGEAVGSGCRTALETTVG